MNINIKLCQSIICDTVIFVSAIEIITLRRFKAHFSGLNMRLIIKDGRHIGLAANDLFNQCSPNAKKYVL